MARDSGGVCGQREGVKTDSSTVLGHAIRACRRHSWLAHTRSWQCNVSTMRPPGVGPRLPLCQVGVHKLLQATVRPQRRHHHAATCAQKQGRGIDEAGAGCRGVRQAACQRLADVPAGLGLTQVLTSRALQ